MIHVIPFLTETVFDDLPQDVINQAEVCLVDLIAVAASATQLPNNAVFNRFAQRRHPVAAHDLACRLFFKGGQTSATGAAFANASTIDSLDGHDGHPLVQGHVGCSVLPALMAVIESLPPESRPDGQEFLALLTIGYELGTRFGMAQHATQPTYHSSGSWNGITCAGLASRLMGLSVEQTVHALGSAEYFGPIAQMIPEVERPTYRRDSSGWGALVGVECAMLAEADYIGGPPLLVENVTDGLWGDLGQRWRIHEQYFKPYPVCRWAQGPIEAAFQVRQHTGFDVSRIVAIENQIFETGAHLSHGVPTTTEGAQYGLSWPIACALVKGQVEPEDVMPQALDDPLICRLARLVTSIADDDFTQKFPCERWARLVITMDDGQVITSHAHKPTGDPDCPIGAQGMEDKYSRYTVPVMGQTRSEALRQEIARLKQPSRTLNDLLGLVFSPIE